MTDIMWIKKINGVNHLLFTSMKFLGKIAIDRWLESLTKESLTDWLKPKNDLKSLTIKSLAHKKSYKWYVINNIIQEGKHWG